MLFALARSSSEKEMRRMSKLDDPLEKQAIREKLRAKPGTRRDGPDAPRTKGPMVCNLLDSTSFAQNLDK